MPRERGRVKGVAGNRMWDFNWPAVSGDPGQISDGIRALGVDVSPWEE